MEGEVYMVDCDALCFLDGTEGHPQFHTRRQVAIESKLSPNDPANIVSCWAYLLDGFKPELLQKPFWSYYDGYKAGLPTDLTQSSDFENYHPMNDVLVNPRQQPGRKTWIEPNRIPYLF